MPLALFLKGDDVFIGMFLRLVDVGHEFTVVLWPSQTSHVIVHAKDVDFTFADRAYAIHC